MERNIIDYKEGDVSEEIMGEREREMTKRWREIPFIVEKEGDRERKREREREKRQNSGEKDQLF